MPLRATVAPHPHNLVNGDDADGATRPTLALGSTATYTSQVTTTGNVALSSVVVTYD